MMPLEQTMRASQSQTLMQELFTSASISIFATKPFLGFLMAYGIEEKSRFGDKLKAKIFSNSEFK